jgi:hypothetical protein
MIINYNNIVFIIIYIFFVNFTSSIFYYLDNLYLDIDILYFGKYIINIIGLLLFFFGLFMGQLWKCILGISIVFILYIINTSYN